MKKYSAHIWFWVKDYDTSVEQVKGCGKEIPDSFVYGCATFLLDWCIGSGYPVPDYDIRSANPVGRFRWDCPSYRFREI